MIPTSASSSSPAAAAAANCSPLNGNGCGGGGAGAAASQQSTQSLIIGIASLILEGRAIAEDEFSPQAPAAPLTSPPRAEGALRASSPNSYGRPSSTATATATITSNTSDANTFGSNGRQSPMPSTSRGGGGLVTVNITANPRDYVMSGAAHGSSPGGGMPPFLRLMSSAESTHQRWTQKLCQLRQQSPAGSFGAASDMPHMATTTTTAAAAGQGEYVALTINEAAASNGDVADYEIVRRVALKWPPPGTTAGGSSASSSPGSGPGSSENFLHSLQSLASTCLRGGNSTATAGPGVAAPVPTTVSPRPATPPESSFGGYRYAGISAAPIVAPMPPAHSPTAKYQTWFRATPPPPRFPSPLGDDSGNSPRPSGSSGDRKLLLEASSTASIAIPSVPVSERLAAKPPRGSARLETTGRTGADKKAAAKASGATTKTTTSTSSKHPQQGPHCDQFLRKMGLAKGEAAATQEDHFCDMTYLNITCWRWRAYSARMEEILEQGEPLCIEVYLGPASHSILLEQWIITLKEKVPPPTMTLPSLCSAIRSQLCFSQISAWCDLIKKADPHSVYESGRVIVRASTGSAGDLATPGSSPLQTPDSLGASVWPAAVVAPTGPRRNSSSQCPRLHIFYRFKKYDNTACFNAKPNVHNFPNVNMSENCSISVCLKSLPRLNGGIPKVGTMSAGGSGAAAAASKVEASVEKKQQRGSVATNKGNGKCGSQSSSSSSSRSKTGGAPRRSNCHYFIDEDDIDLDEEEEEEEDEEAHQNGGDEASSGSCATNGHERNGSTSSGGGLHISHREKQLLKYRKRMQRRDKSKQPGGVASNSSDQEHQPMEQSDEEEDEKANNRTTATTTATTARPIEMISTGTQTATTCCQQCGSEKTLVCLKCCRTGRKSRRDALLYPLPGAVDIAGMDSSSSTGSLSSADFIHVPRNQGERLLQSIQRTPKAAKKQKKAMRALMATMRVMEAEAAESFAIAVTPSPASKDATLQVAASPSDCKGCKRQKTQHDFAADATNGGGGGDERDSGVSVASAKSEAPRVTSRAEKGEMNGAAAAAELSGGKEPEVQILESETFLSTTKLTPHIDRCSLQPDSYVERRCCTPPSVGESGGGEMTSLDVCPKTAKAQFKTPTAAANQLTLHNGAFLHQTKPQATPHKAGGGGITIITTTTTSSGALVQPGNLLSATSFLNFGGTPRLHPSSLPLRKGLPKVNLTPIFCNPSATLGATSPISITCSSAETTAAGGGTFSFDPDALDGSLEHRRSSPSIPAELAAGSVPVQKSYSAPTLPNSPSLSPRFAKQAAKQRRSRHLSDRSDRSSLGSDEQYSDEDVVGGSAGFYNAAGRSRSSHIFGYAPLVGNLEECLLKKRLVPVVEVQGFKVQLGASGGFCPTQLTFPAVSHFYELPGDTLSTPYVCEIRLPRKGYSVPRAGTIQATLLNTIGTVVRMFVIPYDMRDMPPLHQTFIRQRVLAQAGKAELSAGGGGSGAGGGEGGGGGGDADRRVNGDCSMNGGLYGGPEERNLNNNNIHKYNNNNNNNNNTNVKYKLSPGGGLHSESNLGHFISTENMKRLRYSIHLRFQTSRSGRLSLHSDIRILISRRTDLDTAAAHAKGVLEAPSDLVTDTVMPSNPKYSSRQETSLSSTSSSTSSTACHSGNNNNNIKI